MNNILKKKDQAQIISMMNSTRHLIIQILQNLFQKTKAEEIFPNSFYEANHNLITEPHKDIKRKLQPNIFHEDETIFEKY